MEAVNIDKLMNRANELLEIIDSANNSLHIPVSTTRVNFERDLCKAAPKIAVRLQQSIQRGRIEKVVISGVVLGGAYVGAAIYDTVRNAWTRNKAKEAILGYYQELAVK